MSISQPTNAEIPTILGLEPIRPNPNKTLAPEPIRLSADHIETLLGLLDHYCLENLGKGVNRELMAGEITKPAKYFLNDLAIQSLKTPKATLKQLKDIESAACKLRKALGWDGESTTTIPYDPVFTWLRQAADDYQAKLQADGPRFVLPSASAPSFQNGPVWPHDYVSGWKLPDHVVGARLLELWAKEAQVKIDLTGKATKHALKVAIQRLVICWLSATGEPPGIGNQVNKERTWDIKWEPDGPFVRFALAYFESMRKCVTREQLAAHPDGKKSLNATSRSPSPHTIGLYAKNFIRHRLRS